MKVTIRGKKSLVKLDIGGTLDQKLAFIAALTGSGKSDVPVAPPTEEDQK